MIINYSALLNRVVELLIEPWPTWTKIHNEPDPGRELILRYSFLLALIPTFFGFLGEWIFQGGFLFSLVRSLLWLSIFLGSLFLLGLLINSMSASFGSVQNENSAFKLVAYASTPVWISGFLTLIPKLIPIALLTGFGYAGYLFYVGCQIIIKTPKDKALKFSIISLTTWFVMMVTCATVASQIALVIFLPETVVEKLSQGH